MPTVDELLNASNEVATCTVNPDTREIIVPEKYKILGVFSDEKVTRIPFTCPKVVGNNVDLTEYNLYINYQNAIGGDNAYLVDDVAVSGDNITFSWLLSRYVTLASGVVKYSLCAKKLNGDSISNEWNTTIANGVVIQGLEVTQEIIEDNPDIIEAILSKAHTHNNKSVLDKFAEANGKPTYDGKALGGSSTVELDTTLSETGKAADAKAVGDRLSALSEEIVTTSESKVDAHNTGADTHSDIRMSIQGLTDRLNALADSDDTTLDQLSEVVAYIKSNRSLIDAITTSKVSVADIVNDLVTNVPDKPLSAAQGVVIKTLIDALRNGKLDAAELTNAVNTALEQAKASGEFDGADGHTPVKGVDYWTAADKAEVVAEAASVIDLTSYAKKTEVPTNTSQLTNDSGFLTSHQDISGKQDKATLEADVSAAGFTKNTGTYSKPTGGIPKADLAEAVQTSLSKADTALQSHQSLAAYRTAAAQDEIDSGKVDKVAGKGLSTNDYNATEKSNNASNTSARHSHSNKALLDGIDATKISLWDSGAQQTPLFANTTADCTDTTKVYVLPDGYIYGYINGAWTNTRHQFTNAEALEKVIDATCDIETVSGGNYNLLKVSEVSFSSRLQDNTAGIVASTATNIVTGWIPVRQGKYYAVSAVVDGIKDAEAGLDRNFVQRINAKKADGTILVYNRYPTELRTEFSRGKAYSVPADVTHMMFHIQIQDRTPQSLDISTSAKLKAFEPMIVEGDTAALAVSNSIDFAYVDGDEDIPSVVNYALKHDPYVTTALFSEQTDVAVTKIGAEIGRSLTTAGPTNPNLASVTTAFLVNRPGSTITISSNAYSFQVSEFSAKSDSALARYSGVLDYGTTFTTGTSPYVRIAIRNADGDTADLNILDNITISVSEQSNFVSANRRMDDIEYRLRSVEGVDASMFKRDVDYGIIPTSYYKGVGTNYTTTFNADTQYANFISAWDALISGHSGYVTKTNLGLCSDETQSLYLYDFKPVRVAGQLTPIPKVIIAAGQHGNEKANVFGLYYFVDNLLNNWFKHPALEYLRTNVELLIVPVVNPSGFNSKTYKNSNGVNINRNYDAGWVLVDDSTSDQYGGAEPFDQPESCIIRDLILDNLDASLMIDFHVCSSAAAESLDVMTYYGICPTNDKYYKRMIDVAAHQLTAISTNFNHDYSLGSPDTLSGYMLIYSGAGILRQWVTDQNVIGVLVEGLTGLPNQTVYAANAFKANEELLVNYMITALNYLKG